MKDSPPIRWNITSIGHSATPVVCIEQALRSPCVARQLATRAAFAVDSPFYPGVRAVLPAELEAEVAALASPVLREVFGRSGPMQVESARFALVCAPPQQLAPPQRLPHFDGTADNLFACVLYLSHDDHGGTAFFRHVSTGFEAITDARQPRYFESLGRNLSEFGKPKPAYFAGMPDVFETIATFDHAFNCMVIYPGNVLHSGMIDSKRPPPPSIERGRLTITSFFRVD